MRRVVACVLAFTLFVFPSATAAHAASSTAAETVALGAAGDGSLVEFEGEAIGEPLRAEDGLKWVNVLSGGVALGVVMPGSDAERIEAFGRYGMRGDTIRVTGVLNAACDDHGGDMDVHASTVDRVSPGRPLSDPPHLWKLTVSAVLLAVTGFTVWRYRRARREYERA